MVGTVLVAGFLFQRVGKAAQASQRIQLQPRGVTVRRHHGGQTLLFVISIVPLTTIGQQALAQFAMRAVLVGFCVSEGVDERRQVTLFVILKLPAFPRRQATFDELPVFIIIIGERFACRQFHFGQHTVRVVIEAGHLTRGVAFPNDLAVTPLATGNPAQRIDFPYHQPVWVVMIMTFPAFTVQIGGDTGIIIITEAVMPVTTGGISADDTPLLIISEVKIRLVGIVPAGHPPLGIVLMPQVVVLEWLTFVQVAVRVIVARHQPLGRRPFK
ncbi:hypothetical protein Xsze_02042 [Xenorhabdus szentirmaii DSM 16338]|nr:hypothetical protein Xsze_02042 [Xenorhabdus szentirmaii DSM 16338]